MATYSVRFEIEIPGEPPLEEVEKFVEFELGARHQIRITDNDLQDRDLQSFSVRYVSVSRE